MQESLCRSVRAYAVDRKGAAESWVVDQIAEDINTIGLKNERHNYDSTLGAYQVYLV